MMPVDGEYTAYIERPENFDYENSNVYAKLLITSAQVIIGSTTGGYGIPAIVALEKFKQQIN